MPVEHYENFPVASVLLPARSRKPVKAMSERARHQVPYKPEGFVDQ